MKKITLICLVVLIAMSVSAQSTQSKVTYSLQECVDIAIENNLTVRRSELSREGAKINFNQARANRLPDLNAGGSAGYNWGRSIDPTTNQFISQQISFSGVNANSSVTVFNWFRITNTIKQNRLLVESAEYGVDKAKNDISLMVVTAYLNVIFNQELLSNADYQLNSSKEQLDRTAKLVKGGALPLTSELELVSQVATNEVQKVTAENNLQLAILNLKQIMLIPSNEEINIQIPELGDDISSEMDITPEELYAAAVKAMPEIQSADLQVESSVAGVRVAEAGYTPTVALNGSLRTNYSDAADRARPLFDGVQVVETPIGRIQGDPTSIVVADLAERIQVGEDPDFTLTEQYKENLSTQLSLSLSVPIFNNLRTASSVQRAKISLQQAEITAMETRNQLRQTIEQAYNDAFAASKTFSASKKQVAALEETFRSIQNQYNLGAANFTEFQVASNNLFRAKSDLVRAKFDYIFKSKVLDFYQGKTLEL
ncbi:MAG: TolC family protein [Cyclobacteriaceae bacterium]